MSKSHIQGETTRKLLRDFLCKAAKRKSPDHCANQEVEMPSASEELETESTLEISGQTSVIKYTNAAVNQIKDSGNNEKLCQHRLSTAELSAQHGSVFITENLNLAHEQKSISKYNEQLLQNHTLQHESTQHEKNNCFLRSNIMGLNSNEECNQTNGIYINKESHDQQLLPLNLGLAKINEEATAHDYSINLKNHNSFFSSDVHNSTDSTIATSPVSLIECSRPNTPMEDNISDSPNSVDSSRTDLLTMKSRFLKKAWPDRDTEEETDISNSTESEYESSNEGKFLCDRMDLNPEVKLYDAHHRNRILQYYDSKIRMNFNTKYNNARRLQARKHFYKGQIEHNRNIITLDAAAISILEQAKKNNFNYNKILNNRPMNEICKTKKIFKDDESLKKDYSDVDTFEYTVHKNLNKKDMKKFEYTFLQDGPCFQVAPKLSKCRECRWTQNQDLEDVSNIFCRFYSFRKLRYTKNLVLATAGFSDPYEDPSKEDVELWLPNKNKLTENLDIETSYFILKHVGDQFCELVEQEKHAAAISQSEDGIVAWKKLVRGVREMCDVCETTLFNVHWTCGKCGFIVCLDCYKHRLNDTQRLIDDPDRDLDEFNWLLCTNRTSHELTKLMLTQIIPGDSLILLCNQMHEISSSWNLQQTCANSLSRQNNGRNNVKSEENIINKRDTNIEQMNTHNEDTSTTDSEIDDGSLLSFRDIILGSDSNMEMHKNPPNKKPKKQKTDLDIVNDIISIVLESKSDTKRATTASPLKQFTHRHCGQTKLKEFVPTRIMTMTHSSSIYPEIPHSWLCDGKLLCLQEANNPGNYQIFQDQWKTGQPILVANVSDILNMNLWHPDTFAADFGLEKNDLINCMNGKIVPNQPMGKFWEGFEHFSKRLRDEEGNPMLLKLKDWPPGEDFAELLPTRFQDLIKALPLGEYTKRDGKLNLASCLPECFVKPDLGPKMYNAYGSALHPTKGTTNLHMDISDAVNIMVYVGIPKDGDDDAHIKEAFRAIDEAGCDILTRRRVRCRGELPGALWHIYTASDADKIRDLLNKVALERGNRLEPHHDPIHDQNWYLDSYLRERLYKEYGVEGYAIVQCRGDAIFIPAGAPHQVRNLHNCIKVAEDFVSPENVSNCFHLTREFRELSDTHTNHEDKLQIKNIIYHAVKEALTSMSIYLKEDFNTDSLSKA